MVGSRSGTARRKAHGDGGPGWRSRRTAVLDDDRDAAHRGRLSLGQHLHRAVVRVRDPEELDAPGHQDGQPAQEGDDDQLAGAHGVARIRNGARRRRPHDRRVRAWPVASLPCWRAGRPRRLRRRRGRGIVDGRLDRSSRAQRAPRCCASARRSSGAGSSTDRPWPAGPPPSGSGLPLEARATVKPPRSRRSSPTTRGTSSSSGCRGTAATRPCRSSRTGTASPSRRCATSDG